MSLDNFKVVMEALSERRGHALRTTDQERPTEWYVEQINNTCQCSHPTLLRFNPNDQTIVSEAIRYLEFPYGYWRFPRMDVECDHDTPRGYIRFYQRPEDFAFTEYPWFKKGDESGETLRSLMNDERKKNPWKFVPDAVLTHIRAQPKEAQS